jgi:tetratricopeptide (TPR) repeat protein
MIVWRGAASVVLLSLLAACAGAPQPVPSSAPSASRPAPGTATAPVTGARPAPVASSPIDGLLAQARAACEAGDLDGGLARLDRAQRIDPRRAGLYLEMARCYAGEGDADRAAGAAERGLAYCYGSECRDLRRYMDR